MAVTLLVLGCYGGPWPSSSDLPPQSLSGVALPRTNVELPFRFAVFGDQRALADGEWQRLIRRIDVLSQEDSRLLFVIDTGDIVQNGTHRDQFVMHKKVLGPLTDTLPYWVTVGNHEVDNNRSHAAREYLASFLSETDSALSPDRMYYKKTVGGVRFLFLDSNDMVYVGETPEAETRRVRRLEEQLTWLTRELSGQDSVPTVVGMHHPLIQTSAKHVAMARELWSFTHEGRTLADVFLDGGVDLVLTGHTHSYERFRISREDGNRFHLVNVSGRPRNSFLMFGAGQRRAKDIAGQEMEWLKGRGWHLEEYVVEQLDAMVEEEANQFGVVTVTEGGFELEVYFDDGTEDEWRRSGSAPLN